MENALNQLIVRGAHISLKSAGSLGRGIFSTKAVKRNDLILTATPLAAWLSPKASVRLDRSCNHCFRSSKLGPCAICEDEKSVMTEQKKFHKILKNIHKHQQASTQLELEPLLYKLAHRVCLERSEGYENTNALLNFMAAPDVQEENREILKYDHELLQEALTDIGYPEELNAAIDIDWFCRTLGVLFLHHVETSLPAKGVAMYDSLSFFNHSCKPNVEFSVTSGMEVGVVAVEDIEDGDELFVNYLTLRNMGKAILSPAQEANFDKQQEYLVETYGFDCTETCTCGRIKRNISPEYES